MEKQTDVEKMKQLLKDNLTILSYEKSYCYVIKIIFDGIDNNILKNLGELKNYDDELNDILNEEVKTQTQNQIKKCTCDFYKQILPYGCKCGGK